MYSLISTGSYKISHCKMLNLYASQVGVLSLAPEAQISKSLIYDSIRLSLGSIV